MKKRLLSLLLLCTLVFALSGCGEKTLLNKKKPVSLSFWHVYGEQAGSPMDLLVQEFNRTVGQERGVQVQVTGMSSASQIGGYLKEAQSGGKGVQEMPDLFTCHIIDALELGEDIRSCAADAPRSQNSLDRWCASPHPRRRLAAPACGSGRRGSARRWCGTAYSVPPRT